MFIFIFFFGKILVGGILTGNRQCCMLRIRPEYFIMLPEPDSFRKHCKIFRTIIYIYVYFMYLYKYILYIYIKWMLHILFILSERFNLDFRFSSGFYFACVEVSLNTASIFKGKFIKILSGKPVSIIINTITWIYYFFTSKNLFSITFKSLFE